MSRGKSLFQNTLIISLGTFLPKITGLITLPIITAGLAKADYGTYDLIATLVSLLLPMVTLQIQTSAFRFLIDCRGDEVRSSRIVTNIFLFSLPISLVVLCVLFGVLSHISFSTRCLICLYFFSDILTQLVQQIVRGLSYNKLYSASCIIRAVFNMLLVVYTIGMRDGGLNGILISVIFASIAALVFLTVFGKVWKLIRLQACSWAQIRELLAYSWPMVPNSLSLWVLNFSNRAVLTAFIGLEATAVYAVANKIPMLFAPAQSAFVQAWQENASIAQKDKDANAYYSQMFEEIFRILSGIMAILISCTPLLFVLLIRGDYSAAYPQMPFLFLGMLFSAAASFLGGIYVAHKKTRSVGLTSIFAAGINLAVDLLCIRLIGIYAASVATLVSYAALFFFRLEDVKKFQPIRIDYKKLLLLLGCLIVMCVFCWINTLPSNIVNAVGGVAFAVFFNRKIIKTVWRVFCDKLAVHRQGR